MKSQAVQYEGKTYRCVLTLLGVFSQFYLMYPFQTKYSREVKENIDKAFAAQGMPETLQSDNGKEFKRSAKRFCRMKKIRRIQSRPYNPRAQGKVEQSDRVQRNKISFDMVTQIRSVTNWIKNLPNYMKCLNNKKREDVGWLSPVEV